MTIEKPSPDSADTKKKIIEQANTLNKDAPEYGGQEGPDPTRYGDWEKGGRCTDF